MVVENIAEKPRSFFDKLDAFAKAEEMGGIAYVAFASGGAKGIAKLLSEAKLQELKSTYGAKDGDAIIFMVGKGVKFDKFSGRLRNKVGEELGFVGAVAILLLYGALIVRGIIIGMHAKDRFGSLVAFGMVFQLGLQVALNVAVVTDTLPNTGIGLPFFSYGGSSMWLCLAEMGAILSVSRQANMPKIYTFKNIKAR